MPELPDVSVYVEALQARVVGHQLVRAMVKSPFLLRSTAPPISATHGRTVREVRRVGDGEAGLQTLNAGGLEPLDASLDAFTAALRSENHTLKRSLTDPHIFSGIGNSYSDEILHRAQLSPVAMSQKLSPEEIERLYDATRATLLEW